MKDGRKRQGRKKWLGAGRVTKWNEIKRMEMGVGGIKRKDEIEILVEIKEWENKKVREDKWKKNEQRVRRIIESWNERK